MKLKNVLIVVKDLTESIQFYHNLFGLDVALNNPGNVILTEGLVLQEESLWKKCIGETVISNHNSCELYFEEANIDAFVQTLDTLYPNIKYVNKLMTREWGQKLVQFYDLDGHLIEVRTPIQ